MRCPVFLNVLSGNPISGECFTHWNFGTQRPYQNYNNNNNMILIIVTHRKQYITL